MAIGLVKRYLANPSMKNVLMIMSGTFLSQVLPILFFPILSRLYTPADYGVLGIFMSISMLLTVISNLQLNHAILIPKENDDALSVLFSGVIIVSAFAAVIAVPSFLFADEISGVFNAGHYTYWVYFLPFTILLSGLNIQLSSWFIRQANFKVITRSRVSAAVVSIFVSLGIVLIVKGPFGLTLSYFASALVNTIILLSAFKYKASFKLQPVRLIRANISKYQQFSIYTLPTELISNFAQQLPLFIFSVYSGVQSVGWFSRSRQILGIPITYFSSSIAEVYKQKASEAFRNNPANLRPLFVKTFRHLFFVSIFPFLAIAIFAPDIFAIAFGENWREAGVFTQALSFMYFLKLICSPLSYNFYLFNKQRLDLILHLIIILLTSAGMYLGFAVFDSGLKALLLFSAGYGIIYLVYGYYSYRLTGQKMKYAK
jgi:O-antigen/teichoic acid export membrane protein